MKHRRPKPRYIATAVTVGVTIALVALYNAAFSHSQAVETVYSRVIYKGISAVLSAVFGVVDFAVGELLLYLTAAGVVAYVVLTAVRVVKSRGCRLTALIAGTLALVRLAAALLSVFIVFWGFNYARLPLADSMGLTTQPVSAQVLQEVCFELTDQANELRAQCLEEDGVFALRTPRDEVMASIPAVCDASLAGTPLEFARSDYSGVKPVLASESLCWFGISGIYFPFTGEANINAKIPDVSLPALAIHEASHQMGFAREDEAGFMGYYLAVRSDDPDVAYSGVLHALTYAGNALFSADADLWREVADTYSDGLRRDLNAVNQFWDQYRGETMDVVETMNNNYLKANRQDDGVKSYGRMVDLIIALYLDSGLPK